MKFKPTLVALGLTLGLAGAAASGAEAQLVPFQGTTLACFSATMGGCTPTAGVFSSIFGAGTVTDVNGGRVHFNTTSFSFAIPKGATHVFNVGNFTAGSQYAPGHPVLINEFFTLALALTHPGSSTQTFYALATGQLTFHNDPSNPIGITLDFNPSSPSGNFTNGPIPFNGGTYSITALGNNYPSDVFHQPLYASATVTPEPVSMTLFGTGLGGLAFLRRRRKKTAEQANA